MSTKLSDVDEYLVAEALSRREIFNHLSRHLEKLKEAVLKVDPKAGVYLFGSVADGTHTYSSDIDILVITREKRLKILSKIVEEGFVDPFEIHVRKPEEAAWYKRMVRLVRI